MSDQPAPGFRAVVVPPVPTEHELRAAVADSPASADAFLAVREYLQRLVGADLPGLLARSAQIFELLEQRERELSGWRFRCELAERRLAQSRESDQGLLAQLERRAYRIGAVRNSGGPRLAWCDATDAEIDAALERDAPDVVEQLGDRGRARVSARDTVRGLENCARRLHSRADQLMRAAARLQRSVAAGPRREREGE